MRDLFANRTRTVLVVLSIAVGVFAVGAVQSSQNILTREMNRTWNSTRPASARLSLSAFEQDFVESIQRMPEIVATEGRRSAWARTTSGQETKQIELVGIRDFDDIHVGAIFPEQVSPGTWPPPKRQILLERNSLAFLGVAMEVYGPLGYLHAVDRVTLRKRMGQRDIENTLTLPAATPPVDDVFAFLAAFLRGEAPVGHIELASLHNNMIVVEILEAARNSARTGQTVHLQ